MANDFEEKREFLRIDYETPVEYREVRMNKLSPKTDILTKNISPCGLLFVTRNLPPALSTVIWVKLDQKMRNICSEIESDLIVRGGGLFGKVVRISEGEPGVSYEVGVAFLRRKNMTDREVEDVLSVS